MATWNGTVLTLDNDAFTTANGSFFSMASSSTSLGTTLTAGKAYVITGWCLWTDTAAPIAARLKMGSCTTNDGVTANTTIRAAGWVGCDSTLPSLRNPWIASAGTAITLASGAAFTLVSSASCTLSGYVMLRQTA